MQPWAPVTRIRSSSAPAASHAAILEARSANRIALCPSLANADLVSDPGRAGARAHLRAMGLRRGGLGAPARRDRDHLDGDDAVQPRPARLAAHVADGIRAAGGTPVEFNTIAVSDNLTQGTPGMRASLVSREVIADSIELVGRSQPFDGLICLAACDKTVPGRADGARTARRPGVPLLLGRGGCRFAPRPPGHDQGRLGGRRRASRPEPSRGRSSTELERDACPGIGACAGQFTANTMAVASDFLGLAPAGAGGILAEDPAKAGSGGGGGPARDGRDRPGRPAVVVSDAGVLRERDRRRRRAPAARRTPCSTCSRSPRRQASSSASRTSTGSRARRRG